MAVHLPLTPEAQKEARELMATSANMLNPSNGEPIVSPTQDMILGCYYLTKEAPDSFKDNIFSSFDDASIAFMNGEITLHTQIRVRGWVPLTKDGPFTTYGRMIFHAALPEGYPFQNMPMTKKQLSKLLSAIFEISKFSFEHSDVPISNPLWTKKSFMSAPAIYIVSAMERNFSTTGILVSNFAPPKINRNGDFGSNMRDRCVISSINWRHSSRFQDWIQVEKPYKQTLRIFPSKETPFILHTLQ
jgi:DNA-directed RNA polymerase beta' subunit